MKTKRIILLIALCLTAAIFTGCSGKKTDAQSTSTETGELTEYSVRVLEHFICRRVSA